MARKTEPQGRDSQLFADWVHINGPYLGTRQKLLQLHPPMNPDLHEYRYEQRGDAYALRCWHNGTERMYRGFTPNMPEWLVSILATAKVAGAIRPIKEPPPEVIVWFRTDENHNLVEFIEMA